jgi:trehalose synthase
LDLTNRNQQLWDRLVPTIEKYDAVVFSAKENQQDQETPQLFIMPGIDPFSIKNRELSDKEINERLDRHEIPTDLPLVVQVSRFDRWKDPRGVIEAFKIAREEIKATLVLLGNVADDDPEGPEIYESLLGCREERIIIKSVQDTALVNALHSRAAVILQKSLREGFGLTVAEAMWKQVPVIGGDTSGIRFQIQNGVNGYIVSSVKEAARRIVQLVNDKELREKMGKKARETVKKKFLLTRYVEQFIDLFNSFETVYKLHR